MDEVLKRGDIDLVLLAIPNYVHKEIAIATAKAGKSMVLTKPLARNAAEAKEMLDAVKAADVMHGYAETARFSPAVVKARDLIQRGGSGTVLAVGLDGRH